MNPEAIQQSPTGAEEASHSGGEGCFRKEEQEGQKACGIIMWPVWHKPGQRDKQ